MLLSQRTLKWLLTVLPKSCQNVAKTMRPGSSNTRGSRGSVISPVCWTAGFGCFFSLLLESLPLNSSVSRRGTYRGLESNAPHRLILLVLLVIDKDVLNAGYFAHENNIQKASFFFNICQVCWLKMRCKMNNILSWQWKFQNVWRCRTQV